MTETKVAVVTGNHPYDVIAFHELFRSLRGVKAYIQNFEEFAADQIHHSDYDVVLFYNMHLELPDERRGVLEALGASKQGVFILHHALLAFPKWSRWSEIVGIRDRSFEFYHDQDILVEVADPEHFITRGMESWTMVDETYVMNDADEGCHVLLTSSHARSMKTLGWTHEFGESRVFCLALGHDNQAYSHPRFRELIERGIEWCGRADEGQIKSS
jgi:type 1 glutamine amidotransferase